MAHLFWKDKNGRRNLLSKKFSDEKEFENLIVKDPTLLGEDIFIIANQVRGGSKRGIPDIIGYDEDGNVCIIEMKDETVTSEIVHQILKYALWAKQNPSELQNIWLKADDPPDDREIDFERPYGIRIIIVAPHIDPSASMLKEITNFPVDLFEVKRWSDDKGGDEFLLVDKIEPSEKEKPSVVRGKIDYNEQEYAKIRNRNAVKQFWKMAKELEKICSNKKWPLKLNPRKGYCHMQYGIYNVFGLDWLGSKSFALSVNLPLEDLKKHQPKMAKIHHRTRKKHTRYEIDENTSLQDYIPLFQAALNLILERRD